MNSNDIPQAEADALLSTKKSRVDSSAYELPWSGGSTSIPLISVDHAEHFLLDISRCRVKLSKVKYQGRARQIVVLARLDIGGPGHRNPDDTEVGAFHLHLYREGYADKFAYDVPAETFTDLSDPRLTLRQFMSFINVVDPPFFRETLFR